MPDDLPGHANIAQSAIVHPNVILGDNVTIEEFCIIGYPPKGVASGEMPTRIGSNTHIRSHTIIYAGVEIGANCNLSHSIFIREHTSLGDKVSVGINCVIEHHCSIGNNVRIQGQAGLAEYTIVEDDAWIGPRTLTANVFHPTCERAKECLNGPTIRRGAIIGGNAFISPDTDIGERSFIGAGSVVTKSVEAGAMMFGVPAKKIGTTDSMKCPYDMVQGSPYAQPAKAELPKIQLIDLAAQHQTLKQEIRMAMESVILNTRFINGKEVGEFEAAFAAYCGVPHVVGVGNGTVALELVLRALGIGPGDEVITQPNTFIATAEAIAAVGAKAVFVDVIESSQGINPEAIERAITASTRAIMPVHLFGQVCNINRIAEIAERHGLKIIEDAAQAHGAALNGRRAGQWGAAACFSFYPGKNLGAYGDAGAIATTDSRLAERVRKLRDHGRSDKYVSDVIGGNHRFDTIQAAVLNVKLRRLDKWNEARRRNAASYRAQLAGLPITLPVETPAEQHVYHLFVIRSDRRDELQKFLAGKGVSTGVHYPVPLHLQPALQGLGYKMGDFPVVERLAGEILSLPMYPEMTDAQVTRVVDGLKEFFADARTA